MNKVYCILVTVFLTVSLNACKRANEVHSLNVFENTNDASTYTNLETTAPYWDTDAFPETSDPIENTTPSEPTDPEIAETEDTEQQDTTAPTDPPATTLPEPDITEATEDPTTPSVYTYLSVIYYNQSGEKIRCYVQPITDRYANVVINENGTYHYFSVGDYSD